MDRGSVHKFFAVSDRPLSIAQDFAQFESIPALKQQLLAKETEVYTAFKDYSKLFRKRLGLQSEKALDLFNQTVSIKEIGGLNDFVRNHMLEKTDVQAKIQGLQTSYEDLTASHTAIQQAKRQLEGLEPLAKEAKKYTNLENKVAALANFLEAAPVFFAGKQQALLIGELTAIGEQLAQAESQRAEFNRLSHELRKREKAIEAAIAKDNASQQLRSLSEQIERSQQAVEAKKQKSQNYNRLAAKLNLADYSDRQSFYAAQTQSKELQETIGSTLQTLENQRDRQKLQQGELKKQQQSLSSELVSLRSRKSQIPARNLALRDRITQALNLSSSELPFIGELLQVRPEANAWEGAIERLLRGFGLCLLVPQAHYESANRYINKTNLQGRVIYYRVKPAEPDPTWRGDDPNRVPHKLKIKQDDETFYQWLKARLTQQFNYTCCDSISKFQQSTKAITPEGLIKHSAERHEKDDRSRIGDRAQYILGWDNASKIEVLETDLQQINSELAQVEQQICKIEQQQQQQRQQESELQDFMRIEEFVEIDWRSAERDRLELESQRKALEAASNQLKQLQAQLDSTQAEIAEAENRKEQSTRDVHVLEYRQAEREKEKAQCESKLAESKQIDLAAFEQGMAKSLAACAMTLESVAQDESHLEKTIQEQLTEARSQHSTAKSNIEKAMLTFKKDFPEITSDLSTSIQYLTEYLALKAQIERDDLPKHEARFKQLMTTKVAIAVSTFKTNLEQQEAEIKTAIDGLNQSLGQINYTESTYIRLRYDSTRAQEIRDFKNNLKACLGDVGHQSAEDNERLFKNIQTLLIERFQSSDRWTKLVTDVRNWLDFSVSERYRETDQEKEHHTDSSGKSGGQKVKLAYTILASAIAYQFGLNQDPNALIQRRRSFRFVVIDEAFSKSDDSNARYAMELFKNLQLQLLVITPKDKINVIEPYISSLHYVSNNAEGSDSTVNSMTIETYRQNRERALQSTHD